MLFSVLLELIGVFSVWLENSSWLGNKLRSTTGWLAGRLDFGSYSFCVALFDTTGRFCDYHFQSYFQVPIETREDWLDTADIVQVTFFANSQQHLSLCLGDSEPLLYWKEFKTFNAPRVQVHQGCYRVRGRLGIENFSRSDRVSLLSLYIGIIFISSFSRGTKVNLRNVERKLLTCPDIQVALMQDYKHCQRHNGPEGWVLSTKYQPKQNTTS